MTSTSATYMRASFSRLKEIYLKNRYGKSRFKLLMNGHRASKNNQTEKNSEHINRYTGTKFIKTANPLKLYGLIKKYGQAIGDFDNLKKNESNAFEYADHVSRIRTYQGDKPLGIMKFTVPDLDPSYQELKLDDLDQNFDDSTFSNSCATRKPEPYDYSRYEVLDPNNLPTDVYPSLDREETSVALGQTYQNVLHMPIKICQRIEANLAREERLCHRGKRITKNNIYLPDEFKPFQSLINRAIQCELKYNPNFIDQYNIFLSVSSGTVDSGESQRRYGWHVDGHQGFERLQSNGIKLPTDRQYIISNVLGTEYLDHQFDLTKLRKYCRENYCTMDDVNFQDVVEFYVSQISDNEIHTLPDNQLTFLNPYMVHRAQLNPGDPVHRTFIRILCSVYDRNRLGDTFNPSIGPVYPMKIKTIEDIHEIKNIQRVLCSG